MSEGGWGGAVLSLALVLGLVDEAVVPQLVLEELLQVDSTVEVFRLGRVVGLQHR